MDLNIYNRNKVSQMLPVTMGRVLDGTFYADTFAPMVTDIDYERIDPMLHIFEEHTQKIHIYNASTFDMFRALFSLINVDIIHSIPKEDASIRILINIMDQGMFSDAYINAPIIEFLKQELEGIKYLNAAAWVSQNITDASALFNLPGFSQDNTYVGYSEKHHTFCVFLKTNMPGLNISEVIRDNLKQIFLQLQAVIIALYPHFVDEDYLPVIEQEYNYRFTNGATPKPSLEEFQKHYHYIPCTSKIAAIEQILFTQAKETEDSRIESIRTEIEESKFRYEDKCMELERLAFKIKSKELELLVPSITTDDLRNMARDIATIQDIQHMEFTKNSDNKPVLKLWIHTPIAFDPDLLDQNFLRSGVAFEFFSGLRNKEFMAFFSQEVDVRTDTCNPSDGKMGISFFKNHLISNFQAISNPHLEYYGCMGTNKDAIVRARTNHNWVVLALQCVNMVGGINLADYTVMDKFINTYLHPTTASKNLFVYLPNGSKMTWPTYYARKKGIE